jgi:hypothetical protein
MTSIPPFTHLGADNYAMWKVRAYSALVMKGQQSAVDARRADIEPPPPTEAELNIDLLAKHFLLSVMDDVRSQQCVHYTTAREMWEALEATHNNSIPARRNVLYRDFISNRLGSQTMHQYFDVTKAHAVQLAMLGEPKTEEEQKRVILDGLRDRPEYYNVLDGISLQKPPPTLTELQIILSSAEQTIKERKGWSGRDAPRDNRAFVAYNGNNRGASNNRNKGRFTSNNKSSNNPGERKPAGPRTRCYECKQYGHYKADCPQLNDGARRNDGPRRNEGSGRNTGPPRMLAFPAQLNKPRKCLPIFPLFCGPHPPSDSAIDAILDSGSGINVVNTLSVLTDYKELPAGRSVLGISGESTVAILGVGTAYVETTERIKGLAVEGNVTLMLRNVYFCPDSSANLISIGKLTDAGATYEQGSRSASISIDGQTLLTTTRSVEGLFALPLRRVSAIALVTEPAAVPAAMPAALPAALPAATLSAEAAHGVLAHEKSGHVGYGTLMRLVSLGKAASLGVTMRQLKAASLISCEACLLGKAARLPAPPSSNRSNEVLGRVHTDLMGPMRVKSPGGSSYVLNIYDECTRFSHVTPLASKADVPSTLISVLKMLEVQTGRRVKVLRSDHGSEFDNSTVDAHCKDSGTLREFSPPYDPRLNGRAERLGRTNAERMRAVMAHSGVPQELWAEAMVTVNHQRNRLPVTGLDVSPYEALTGKQPDLSKWHPFGCKTFSRDPKPNKSKLADRGELGWMMGYEPGGGFRIYFEEQPNPKNPLKPFKASVEVRRDVKFIDSQLFGDSNPPPLEADDEDDDFEEPGIECMACQSTSCSVPSQMLLCDNENCENGLHLTCCTPPISTVPDGLWFCPACSEAVLPNEEKEEEQPLVVQPAPKPPQPEQPPQPPQPEQPPGGSQLRVPSAPRIQTRSQSRIIAGDGPDDDPDDLRARTQPQRTGRAASGDPNFSKQQRLFNATLLKAFLAVYPPEPTTLAAAKLSREWPHWETAIREELTSLMEMQTWTIREVPPGARVISHTWVFARKLAPDGSIVRYKARLVAHGFKQIEGVDFDETFAPVSRHPTIRALLAHANQHDLEIRQLDVKTAFLNGKLEEETWLVPPEALGPVPPGHACFLHRALYGLRQSPRVWYETIRDDLESIGFETSPADLGLFSCRGQRETVFLVLYVDDCLIIGPKTGVQLTTAWMCSQYKCHDLGDVATYLGMQIVRDRSAGTLKIHQAAYTKAIFTRYNLENCRPRITPMEHGLHLSRVEGQPLPSDVPFSSLVGTLLYLSVCTRPDISFSVSSLTRHLQKPTVQAWDAAKGIVRYLAGTIDMGITFTRSSKPQPLHGFSDSDFAADVDTRRSVSGFCFGSRISSASSCTEELLHGPAASRRLWQPPPSRQS